MKLKNSIPISPEEWMEEISKAYIDAYETIPFGKITGAKLSEDTLFQLAPLVCLKFRKLKKSKKNIKQSSDASLSSYVATKENTPELFKSSQMSFAFCYIASHFGMNLIDSKTCSLILQHIEQNLNSLIERIDKNSRTRACTSTRTTRQN